MHLENEKLTNMKSQLFSNVNHISASTEKTGMAEKRGCKKTLVVWPLMMYRIYAKHYQIYLKLSLEENVFV